MILKDWIATAPDDRIIYIGARVSFFAAGRKGEIIPKVIEAEKHFRGLIDKKRKAQEVIRDDAIKRYGEHSTEARRAQKRVDQVPDMTSLFDRAVLEVFERTCDGDLNVIIDGDEQGWLWSLDEGSDAWKQSAVDFNETELVGAIIAEVVRDYKSAFSKEIAAFAQVMDRVDKYRQISAKWESYFRSDDFKTFAAIDPEYMIKRVRREAIASMQQRADTLTRGKKKR